MENEKECLLNADVAFNNKQYEQSLVWYEKLLAQSPDNLYALSRAGTVCVATGRFDDAYRYFGHARELDPKNGDNAFNYANACFFNQEYAKAFSYYVEAEKLGCSENVTPRLYYQMALLCSMRQDVKSALIYFRKCEDADLDGSLSLSPDLISEKLKLHLSQGDYANAERYAAQMVAIEPTVYKNYMVYFSILMGHKDYATAEKVLRNAGLYADMKDDDRLSLTQQLAALYTAKANSEPENREALLSEGIRLLEDKLQHASLTDQQRDSFLMSLSEICQKAGQFDKAISCLQQILNGAPAKLSKPHTAPNGQPAELTPEELEAMMEADMMMIQDCIDTGALDGELGLYAETEYDESGNLVPKYDESAFDVLQQPDQSPEAASDEQPEEAPKEREISLELREKVYFGLLSNYLEKDDYQTAELFSRILRCSQNRYYQYYGTYTDALITRKLHGSCSETEQKYAAAIAYFRGKLFSDPSDKLAVIFRARLYAEQGKAGKAKELASLLADSDRDAVLRYIEELQLQ